MKINVTSVPHENNLTNVLEVHTRAPGYGGVRTDGLENAVILTMALGGGKYVELQLDVVDLIALEQHIREMRASLPSPSSNVTKHSFRDKDV